MRLPYHLKNKQIEEVVNILKLKNGHWRVRLLK